MNYVFFSIGLMCLLILLLENLVLIVNTKKEKLFYTNFLCKYSMSAIKAMAMLMIIMGHLGNIFGVRVFNPLGSCGVVIFLFCLGYGLQKLYYRNNLKNYWKKRFFVFYIPYICIGIIFCKIYLIHTFLLSQSLPYHGIFVFSVLTLLCFLFMYVTNELIKRSCRYEKIKSI